MNRKRAGVLVGVGASPTRLVDVELTDTNSVPPCSGFEVGEWSTWTWDWALASLTWLWWNSLEELPRHFCSDGGVPSRNQRQASVVEVVDTKQTYVLNISILVEMCCSWRFFWKHECSFWILGLGEQQWGQVKQAGVPGESELRGAQLRCLALGQAELRAICCLPEEQGREEWGGVIGERVLAVTIRGDPEGKGVDGDKDTHGPSCRMG